MAKRRKISAPTADELRRIEAEYEGADYAPHPAQAPIAQVASDVAKTVAIEDAQTRAEFAKTQLDAEAHRQAVAQGRLIKEIATDQINEIAIVRDRLIMGPEELRELRLSIAQNGLRLPIEIFEQKGGEKPYGLLSGYRRLYVIRELYAQTGQEKYLTVKAIIREPDALGGAFAAMVEENEIRANLSHFERGRIAVIASQKGSFANTEDAVNTLFATASKAKRSKIRSFAVIFEELGDLLQFPDRLREKDGLRIATALRAGAENQFRDALLSREVTSAEVEWDVLEGVCFDSENQALPKTKGGRPNKTNRGITETIALSSGIKLHLQKSGQGYGIQISGQRVDEELARTALLHLQTALDAS